MACDIILLKISFENSINLGGENTYHFSPSLLLLLVAAGTEPNLRRFISLGRAAHRRLKPRRSPLFLLLLEVSSLSLSFRHERSTSTAAATAMSTVEPHRRQLRHRQRRRRLQTLVPVNSFDFSLLPAVTRRKPGPPGVTPVAARPTAACSPAISSPSPSLFGGDLPGSRGWGLKPPPVACLKKKRGFGPFCEFYLILFINLFFGLK